MAVTFAILVAHFVGDFVFQSTWMAVNKGRNSRALIQHVGVYTAVLSLAVWPFLSLGDVLLFAGITFISHLGTDAITARLSLHFQKQGNTRYYFLVLGFDQLIHYCTLLATLFLLGAIAVIP